MATRRARERRQEGGRVSARKWAEQSDFTNTVVNLPNGVQMFRVKEKGKKLLDIIPFHAGKHNPAAKEGEVHYERTFFTHSGIGPNNQQYVCPAKTIGKKCPICEYQAELKEDEDADEDTIESLEPKRRQLWNVIDLDDKEKGIQIYHVSHFQFGKELKELILEEDEDHPIGYFADPQEGSSLVVAYSEGSFKGRKFLEPKIRGIKERRKQYKSSIVDKAPCLGDILNVLPYDELKSIFLQTDAGDEEGSKPKRKGKKKMKRELMTADEAGIEVGSSVEVSGIDGECEVVKISKDGTSLTVEDEDGDEHRSIGVHEVELLESEEEEKPKKGAKKKAASKKSSKKKDEDWEDEDEDDEEEEDEDEDDEEEEDEDEDEEEDDEDWEDDEEEEDEEEEEPKPKRGAKKKAAKKTPKKGAKKKSRR